MKLFRSRLVASLGTIIMLSLCASCGTSDDAKVTLPDAAPTPGPAVSELIFSGEINRMETVPGKGDTASQVKEGDIPAVALSSQGSKREADGDGDSGIVRLTPDLSNSLSGRRVTVKITLRKSPTNGSPLVKAMYSRPGVATSGWLEFPAGNDFTAETFDYVVPTSPGPRGPDLISIWADPGSQGRSIEIRSVEISAPAQ